MKRIVISVGILLCILVGYIATQLNNTPLINNFVKDSTAGPQGISIKYYGTSTLLFDDGNTQIMSDGFFSRPSFADLVFKSFSPNIPLLKNIVEQEKLDRLAAIFPVHSHHDHAMDSAPLAEITGATVLGSQSTAYLAQGWGLPEQQIVIANERQPYQYGDFKVSLIHSKHVAMPKVLAKRIGMGEKLNQPLTQPARIDDYKEGISYSVHIQHKSGNYLIQGSANYVPSAMDGLNADTVFLGVAGLSNKADSYIENYLKETVLAVQAKTVIPIHWESFAKPASNQTLPMIVDDIGGSLKRIKAILDQYGVEIELMRIGQ